MLALPSNSLIAMTVISGYIASYTDLWALRAGHRVRGTVRFMEHGESLEVGYEKQGIPGTKLNKRPEFVIVDRSEEQWTNTLEDIDATLSLLRAAKKGPTIKNVIFLFSMWTIATPPMHSGRVHKAGDWNDEVLKIFEKTRL